MSKNPKVCIIRQYYFPQEVHLRRDAKALIESGFEVDVICARDKGERLYEKWNGINIYRITIRHLRKGIFRYLYEYLYFLIRATLLLTRLFFKKKYNCIEVDTMPDFLVFSAIIPKLFGRKVILYLFENMPILFSDKYNLSLNHPLIQILRIIEWLCVKFADQTIITHKREEDFLKKAILVLNVPDEELFFSKNWEITYTKNGNINIYDIKQNFKIITHSTLTKIYGIHNILKAIAILKDKYPKIRCEIIGDGEYKKTLIDLAKSLAIEDYILFTGFVPFEEIVDHLKTADIGIVSVLSDYLLPNKLFEYIALGIPVICSSVKAVKDFFYDDELFFYTPHDSHELAKQIEWLMFHYDIAIERTKKAQLKYQENSWSKQKNIYTACHRQLARR